MSRLSRRWTTETLWSAPRAAASTCSIPGFRGSDAGLPTGCSDRTIMGLFQDSAGDIWTGSFSGRTVVTDSTFTRAESHRHLGGPLLSRTERHDMGRLRLGAVDRGQGDAAHTRQIFRQEHPPGELSALSVRGRRRQSLGRLVRKRHTDLRFRHERGREVQHRRWPAVRSDIGSAMRRRQGLRRHGRGSGLLFPAGAAYTG